MRRVMIYLFIVLMLLGTTACEKQEANKLQEVSIMLDWYPNAVHTFLYAGLEKGYFEEEGIDLEILMPAETNDPLRLAAAEKTTLAVSYQPQLVIARANDIPVVSVGSLVGHPLNTLMVRSGINIAVPKDLEGKTVGFSLPVYEAIAKTAIANDGGDISKVNFIDIGWDIIPAIATEKVDAVSGGFINHETILIEKEGYKINVIDPRKYGVPDYYELVIISGEEFAKQNKELLKKFWRAAQKGQDYVRQNPAKALELLLNNQNEQFPLDKEVEEESLDILLELMDNFGGGELSRWQEVIDWMYDAKLIDKKPEAGKCIVQY
ncbi:MAG: ABC transporter substrate-binding protein [Bacillota bacterium]